MTDAEPNIANGETDIRPSVGMAERRMPLWVFVVAALGGGAVLFTALESRRRSLGAPAVKARQVDLSGGAAPPMLFIPPEYLPGPSPVTVAPRSPSPMPGVLASPTRPISPSQPLADASPAPFAPYMSQPAPAQQQSTQPARRDASPVLVIDNGGAVRAEPAQVSRSTERGDDEKGSRPQDTSRARAGAFANRGTTITQGTLIPAVLESALDSTRPGFARAVVSRDVRGFDGVRVLIPRGSRLIGEYGAEVQPGQNRALINWTRLIRPDGATIAIGSPVADTLGRTGIRARVNTHFFERFAGAILQSALDIGVNLASREIGAPAIIALPGALGGVATQTIQPQQITPTLTVKRGTSVSVFVARDLDFTGVEQRR